MSDWCTIESDPGVFTELIRDIGVSNVQVEEIFSLDDVKGFTKDFDPVYGMIFLFKYKQNLQANRETLQYFDEELFFANQVIQNACATQAILAVLLNSKEIDIGKELTELKNFTKELDPQMKGLSISNSELIKNVHNSFNRPEPFCFSKEKPKADDKSDVYHFVSYVPFKGKLYELDGLQNGPILLGTVNENNWIDLVQSSVLDRIKLFGESETMFNLLAIIKDIKTKQIENVNKMNLEKYQIYQYLQKQQSQINEEDFSRVKEDLKVNNVQINEDIQCNCQNVEEAQSKLNILNNEIAICQDKILVETEKNQNYKVKFIFQVENERRKHNYIPLILKLLENAAKKGDLEQLVKDASKK